MNWFIISGFILGIFLGSFIKVLCDRGSWKASIWDRSYCPKCKKTLPWCDLLPVFSYLFLKGKCRFCHHKISIFYLLTEVLVGICIGLIFYTSPLPDSVFSLTASWPITFYFADLLFKIFVFAVFTVIFLVDLRTGLIPDNVTYPSSLIVFVYLLLTTGAKSWLFYQGLLASTVGKYLLPPHSSYFIDNLQRLWIPVSGSLAAAIGGALFFISLILVTRGRGMSWGDVKFAFFLGLVLGFPEVIVAIFLAFLTGAVFSVFMIILKKKHFGQTIPFGPFLSMGAFLALLWGQQIINWYLNSFRPGY